jgi:precorrin-6y C5,15-methyltransferase (decarboxylating) CbiE subunit
MRFDVVGTGPGGPEYMLPVALEAIRTADCLVGAPRLLNQHGHHDQEKFLYRSNLKELMGFLEANREKKKIAVLVSGDPGFHSLLGAISRHFDPQAYRVVPGLSSFQLAMAHRGVPWQNDEILSAHGRDFSEIKTAVTEALNTERRVILLTDRERTPAALARDIIRSGSLGDSGGNRPVWLGENLGMPDERLVETNLSSLAAGADEEYRLCVMIIE